MVGLIMYKILVVITKKDGYAVSDHFAITSQVIEFETKEGADVAYNAIVFQEGYEVNKLYK